jgi:hypothetical protein
MTQDDDLAMSAIADEVSLHDLDCQCDLCVRYWFIQSFEGE